MYYIFFREFFAVTEGLSFNYEKILIIIHFFQIHPESANWSQLEFLSSRLFLFLFCFFVFVFVLYFFTLDIVLKFCTCKLGPTIEISNNIVPISQKK